MYKDLYKKANDSIPLNLSLKEQLKKEAVTDRKINKFGHLYKYGAVAAAIVVVIGVYNILPKIEIADKSEMPMKEEQIVQEPMKMSRGVPMATSEEMDDVPPAYSPTYGLDYTEWNLPEGLGFAGDDGNSVTFLEGDMELKVTLLPYGGLLDSIENTDGEKIDENAVMVSEGENEYGVYLTCGDRDYKIYFKNISISDIKSFVKSIE